MNVDQMLGTLPQRLTQFRQTIPESVRIVAVTKQQSIAAIEAAYSAGIHDIGESRVQELIDKHQQLKDQLPDLTWHFIGRLQTNKVRKALEICDWFHAIDSLKLAKTIDRIARELQRPVPQACLQVKLRADPHKSGWEREALLEVLPELDQLEHIQIRGLMVIPPLGLSEAETFALFQAAKALQTELRSQTWQHIQMDQLSMGMSNDYSSAIAAGATMIRPGRILFGDRPQ